ncbi:MAG: hypothetical protein EOO77_37455 [Oxalobacteraceae bacterium]|nr:MAG: hypothetical protein EOO77_37455 [Oxalobacteraceae bacterium]
MRGTYIKEPRFFEEPYYDEWSHTFLVIGTQQGQMAEMDYLKEVRAWLHEHTVDRCYMVGQRVSFMGLADAMAFKLRWG